MHFTLLNSGCKLHMRKLLSLNSAGHISPQLIPTLSRCVANNQFPFYSIHSSPLFLHSVAYILPLFKLYFMKQMLQLMALQSGAHIPLLLI